MLVGLHRWQGTSLAQVDRLQPVRPALNTITFSLMANISTDVQEVAFAYITEPRENLSGVLEWNIALNVPVTSMQQFEDAALAEIEDKQKLDAFPSPPLQAGTPPGKTATRKKRTAPRPRLMTTTSSSSSAR